MRVIGADLTDLAGDRRARKLTKRCADCECLLPHGMRQCCKPCAATRIDLAHQRRNQVRKLRRQQSRISDHRS